jgi:predicted membrane protein
MRSAPHTDRLPGGRVEARSGGRSVAMEQKEKRGRKSVLTGGMILITLGVLIILHKMNVWGFSLSWPVLLIVIALGTLIQRIGDLGGWIIGCVGVFFLISENLEVRIYTIATFLLPVILILAGLNVLMKHFKRKDDDPDQ